MVAYVIENGIHYIADNSIGFFVKGSKEAFNALGFKGIKNCYQVHWKINKNSVPVKKPNPESEDEDDGQPLPPNLMDGRKSSDDESDDNNKYAQPPTKVDTGASDEDSELDESK